MKYNIHICHLLTLINICYYITTRLLEAEMERITCSWLENKCGCSTQIMGIITPGSAHTRASSDNLSVHISTNFCMPQILLFLEIRIPCKISEPYDNHFWEKSNRPERRGKNAVNSGLYILPAMRSICDIKTGD